MATPYTRTPPQGAPRAGPTPEEEDEELDASPVAADDSSPQTEQPDDGIVRAPVMPIDPLRITRAYSRPQPTAATRAYPPTGTTGGLIPQQAGTWDKRPQPMARLSDDPEIRRQESLDRAQADFEAKQREANPFLFSGAVKSLAKEGGQRYLDRAIDAGERNYRRQQESDREAIIDQRRADVEAQKASNEQRIQQMIERGQMMRRDQFGNYQPVLGPGGRPLYKPTNWKRSVHPADNRPVKERRNRFGEAEYEDYPLATTDDPTDMNMHWNVDGEFVPAMSIDEAIKRGGKTAKLARVAREKKRKDQIKESVAPARRELEAVDLEIATKRAEVADMNQRAEALAAAGNAEEAATLVNDAATLEEALDRNTGELGARKRFADAKNKYENIRAERDGHLVNRDEIADRLAAEGIDPNTDPGYIANEKALERAEQILSYSATALKRMGAPMPVPAAPVATAEEPGTLGGIVQTAKRAGRNSLAALDVLGASNRIAKRDEYNAQADALEKQAANIDQLQPNMSPENRAAWSERAISTAAKLRERAAKMGESAGGQLTAASEQIKKAGDIRSAPAYDDYSRARGAEAVRRFFSDPVEIASNIAAEGALGSVPALALGVGGGITGGLPGAAAGAGIGSFATEYASTLMDTFSAAGVDTANPEAMMQAMSDNRLMSVARRRAAARGIPVAVFDALSGGLGGRTVAPVVRNGLKQILKAGGKEIVEQAGLGMAGEAAGQVGEQLADTGRVDPSKMNFKGIFAEGIGELVPGGAQVATGAVLRGTPGAIAPAAEQVEGGDATPAETAPVTPPPEGTPANIGDRSELEIAEEEFQRRLAASDLSPTERALFDRLRAEGEPVVEPPPPTREERQAQLEEAFGTVRPERVNPVSAEASAEVFQQEEQAAATTERRIQGLLDELSAGNDAERARLLSFRHQLSTEDFLAVLEGVLDYRRNPAGQPDVVAADVQREVDARQNAPIDGETPGVTNVVRIIPAELEAQADLRATDEAQRVGRAMAEAGGDQAYRPDVPESQPVLRDEPPQRAAESASALEAGLAEEERLRQSARGGEALREQLSNANTPESVSDERPRADAEVPVSEPQQPASDVSAGEEVAAARAPVETDPAVIARDRRQYDVLQRRMSSLTKKLGADVLSSPEYQAAWQASEDIKNRHGGMPPGEVSPPIAQALAAEPQPSVSAPPATAELRANNAGLDLPPVSSLTAAQKLAELKAGGITTYAGKPIEEANPAQLSNALGKFRRGELTPEGEKPGAPLLTDRLIKELERLKKGKRVPGAEYFVDPEDKQLSIKDRAFDAALNIAILGLRAGRPLEQVIRLAVARYRAVHQAATDEEVASLTNAITTAAQQPASTASKDTSRVQESLKDRGLPVAPQEYDVRAQNERVAEAKSLIKSQGEVAAEALLQDRNIPADTRVAIGGELLRQKMDAMKKAKPEEAAVLTKDIQRIAEATRSNVSTESGQGVAMHSKIYENLGVRSSMDYVRSVQKDRVRKLGGEKAEQAAQEAADAFNKTKDQAARDAAIERLKKRYTEKPVVKMLNALKGLQRAQELNDLGVLTRDDMIDVAGKALGLPGVSGEKLKHIATLVDRVENAPNLAEAEKAQLELTETLANYKGLDKIDLETAQMTLNVLASMNTQVANAGGNALRLVTELVSVAAVNPTVERQRALWTGFKDGLPLGWDQAKSIWQTGRGTRDLQDKTIGVSSEVERADYRELYPNLPAAVADALNLKKDVLARVGRFMRAVDALAYYPAREAYARMAATKYFEGTLKGTALERKVAETLHTTPTAIRSAREQAKSEGYSGISLARRASEIIEARRGLTPEGAKAAEESEAFGAQTTYTNEPEGLAGVIYRAASGVVDKVRIEGVPILKPWMMFLRTPANIFNAAKNYTPAGFYEAAKGKTITKEGERILNEDEINRRYFQATVGSALMASAFLAVAKGLMDITEKGPEDPEKRKQLMAAGWRPYSFRIGKGPYISYRDTPLITTLSAVGIVADEYKYNGAQRKDLGEQVASALVEAPLKAAFATSPMTGLAELLDSAVSGKGSGLGRTVAGLPANVLIPGVRLASEVDRYIDPKVYDSNPIQQTVPFLRRQGTPRTDIQGRDVESRPSDRFIGMPTADRLDRTLTERGLFIPGVGSTIKLGKEEMTDDQKDAYKRLSGQRIRTRLMGMVPLLERLDPEKAQEAIDRVTRDERERAKGIVRRMPAAKP